MIPSDRYTALQSQEERRRNIAVLQQKEQAHDALRETKIRLENEINERIVAERKLRASERSLRELSGRLLKMQDDERRQRYLVDILSNVQGAIQDGVDVRGYFHWTNLDNFEWARGYQVRFGLIDVDRTTLERTIKPSGRLYARIAQANALPHAG